MLYSETDVSVNVTEEGFMLHDDWTSMGEYFVLVELRVSCNWCYGVNGTPVLVHF